MLQKAYEYFFETLANRTRLRLLDFLGDNGPVSVTKISKRLKLNQTTVSHNLRRLERCGFVVAKRNGKERLYSINKGTKPLLEMLEKHTERFCKLCIA